MRRFLPASFVLCLFLFLPTSATPARASQCQFVLGFQTLHDLIPTTVGPCVDNQANAANGDALEHTANGLLVWRKADNWTAFTDGYRTSINGPAGLATRLNTQRFSWEADYGAPGTTAAPASASASSPGALPAVSHVFLIVMENKEYGDIIGNSAAPYINGLAGQYALATQSYAVSHPSLPNYLALLGGSTFGISSDCSDCLVDAPNLVDQLESAGKTWKAYMENLPGPCFLGDSGPYDLNHDPFVYFQDIRSNPARCQRVVPLTQFSADVTGGNLPDFVWVTPNIVDDMHDGSVAQGDAWLANFVPQILSSAAWRNNGVLVITWDEGASDAGCCGNAQGGHVATLFVSPLVASGSQPATPISHYGLLRTIEDLWGLGHMAHSGDASTNSATGMLHG